MTDRLILGGNDIQTPGQFALLGGNLTSGGGGGVVTATEQPAEEDMTDPSVVLWVDVDPTPTLKVTWLVDGDYGTATVLTLEEV